MCLVLLERAGPQEALVLPAVKVCLEVTEVQETVVIRERRVLRDSPVTPDNKDSRGREESRVPPVPQGAKGLQDLQGCLVLRVLLEPRVIPGSLVLQDRPDLGE